MARRMESLATTDPWPVPPIRLAVGFLVVSLMLTGAQCPWSGSATEGEALDDSAEAMVGNYSAVSHAVAEGGCAETSERPGVDLEIRITRGADGGLEYTVCGGPEECEDSDWRGALEKSPELGWRGVDTRVRRTDRNPSARECEIEWSRTTLVPTAEGIRLERTQRSGVATLEGEMTCSPDFATAYGESLACRGRQVVRARPKADVSAERD